ncbi:unnamed protein product, partial [Ectocarpus sp. 4 AP-2014]
ARSCSAPRPASRTMIALARKRSCSYAIFGGSSSVRAIVSHSWAQSNGGSTANTTRRRKCGVERRVPYPLDTSISSISSSGTGGNTTISGPRNANTSRNIAYAKASLGTSSPPSPLRTPLASTGCSTAPSRQASGRQPPVAPQQPPRGEKERLPAKHIRELRRQQRLKEERAEEVGLPIPPPVTGKGGKGKLILPQSDSYRFVLHIRQLTQDRNLSGVLSALSIAERKEGGVDVHGYNACIGGMAKAKRWADALSLLSRMRAAGVAPNTHCYSNAILACCRCGEYHHAPLLRREMAVAGVPQTLTCYRLELEHFGNKGRWGSALRLLSELKEAGLTPDAKVYNGVLDAFAQSKEWARAKDVLREMASAGHELHARSYRGLIVSATNAGEWRVAWRTFRKMNALGVERSSRSPAIFNSVTAACGAAGRWEEALVALRLTVRGGMAPTFIAYNATLGALGKAGQWKHARRLLKDMQQRASSPSTGSEDSSDSNPGLREGRARGVARTSPREERLQPPDVYSYTSVIDACAKSGERDCALKVLEDMRRAQVHPSLVTYNTLILACGAGDSKTPRGGSDWRRALSFVEEMVSSGVKPDVYTLTAAVAACEVGGEWGEAAAYLKGRRGGAGKDGWARNGVVAQLTILACGKANDWKGGLQVVREMERLGVRPKVGVFNALIEALGVGPQQPKRDRRQHCV